MKKKHISKTIFKIVGIIILFIVLIFSYGHFIGTKGLKIKEYKVIDENLPNEFYGLKIVHISDIHYGFFYGKEELKKLIQKINSLNADIVVFTGDLIDTNIDESDQNDIIEILKGISAKKYSIIGNLDNKDIYQNIMSKSGFMDLNDKFDIIYSKLDKILIAGSSSNLNSNTNINEKLKDTYEYINQNDIKFKILLMHEPDFIKDLNNEVFNLILAGHSHNGQVKIPFIGVLKTPNGSKKYYKEYYETIYGKLYISGGIGTSVLPIRLFNKPSINFYRLVNK